MAERKQQLRPDPGSPAWSSLESGRYQFRLAGEDDVEAVHRLVYRTFVRELGQYADHGGERWVDKFHHKNVYLVAVADGHLLGMLAVHDSPPFSVADALPSAEPLEKLCPGLLEVRLLAIEPDERRRLLFGGLMTALYHYATGAGYSHLAISGLLQRQGMYERMGFAPLGQPLRKGRAEFVPMLLDLARLPIRVKRDLNRLAARHQQRTALAAIEPPPRVHVQLDRLKG